MAGELALRTRIVAALREKGCYVLVTTGVASAGTPDLLVCYRGHFIALEVKAPSGGRVARIQEVVLGMIERAGGTGAVVRSVDEALLALLRADGLG